jgi:hypothetical protein
MERQLRSLISDYHDNNKNTCTYSLVAVQVYVVVYLFEGDWSYWVEVNLRMLAKATLSQIHFYPIRPITFKQINHNIYLDSNK